MDLRRSYLYCCRHFREMGEHLQRVACSFDSDFGEIPGTFLCPFDGLCGPQLRVYTRFYVTGDITPLLLNPRGDRIINAQRSSAIGPQKAMYASRSVLILVEGDLRGFSSRLTRGVRHSTR